MIQHCYILTDQDLTPLTNSRYPIKWRKQNLVAKHQKVKIWSLGIPSKFKRNEIVKIDSNYIAPPPHAPFQTEIVWFNKVTY